MSKITFARQRQPKLAREARHTSIIYIILSLAVLFFVSCSKKEDAVIPVTFSSSGHLYLTCTLNDSVYGNFIFDTGSHSLYLDSTFNAKNSILPRGVMDTAFLVDACDRGFKIKIDTIHHTPESIAVSNLRKTWGCKCDGILDWHIFKNYAVLIDFVRSTFTILDPATLRTDTFDKVPLTLNYDFFYVPVSIRSLSGKSIVNFPFMFDTGYPGEVFVGSGTMPFEEAEKPPVIISEAQVTVENKKAEIHFFKAREVEFGQITIRRPIVSRIVSENSLEINNFSGIIGNSIFRRFHVLIDFKNSRLYVKPNKFFSDKERSFTGLGFQVLDKCDSAIVVSVVKNSKADSLGIKPGDVVLQLNGKSFYLYSPEDLHEMYRSPGKIVKVTFKRKSQILKFDLRCEKFL